MKELSIEEKAKAYDEALKEAVIAHKDEDRHLKATLERIFPELRESVSEDENIKKSLIILLQHFCKGYKVPGLDFPVSYKDMLAWLEKQGEQTSDKIVEKARTEKQRVLLTETDGSANIDWDCRSLNDVKLLLEYGLDYIKKLEKQGEQKPAWSEEDRKIIIELIGIFESAVDGGHVSFPYRLIKDYIRVLKSCLPQTTWKPSEEQIKVLNEVLNFAANHESPHWNDYIFGTLNNHIRQLKKLREE